MTPDDEHDPLVDLLSSVTLPPADHDRREAIFNQTRGVLWRRRFVRRSAWVAALATCYVVGALSVLAWQSTQRNPFDAPQAGTNEKRAVDLPKQPTPAPEPTAESDNPEQEVTPVAPALTTFEKLRRAGDRQLNQRGNLQGAIGCYRRALDVASDAELQIVPERDSWLLIPLKEARLEIRKHAHKKG